MSRLHQIRQNMSERVLDGFRLYVVNNIEAKCRTERMGFTRLFSEYLLIGWCQRQGSIQNSIWPLRDYRSVMMKSRYLHCRRALVR
jgi:hypothetical protein